MTSLDIAQQRLFNQHLVVTSFEKPDEAVHWLGAVQAQEYAGAKWGIALRTQSLTSAAIDQAFAQGDILRTHVMRPTWHFVTPADIRWMLMLTAPRVNAANALYYRRLGLDDAVFSRSNAVLAKSLEGGNQLTRSELQSALLQAGISKAPDDRLRLAYLVMRAELDGVICSGALRGKQHTYALLDERAPLTRPLEKDEALAELTRRYFTSHGPATLKDFMGWSGLAPADAREGLELAKSHLDQEIIQSKTYWFSSILPDQKPHSPIAQLLPAFDEFTVAYRDSSAVLDRQYTGPASVSLGPVIAIDGVITGSWKRTISKKAVSIEVKPFRVLTEAQEQATQAASARYGVFLGLPVVLTW
jgi:hypothetical protein